MQAALKHVLAVAVLWYHVVKLHWITAIKTTTTMTTDIRGGYTDPRPWLVAAASKLKDPCQPSTLLTPNGTKFQTVRTVQTNSSRANPNPTA